jgi:hypothetical protein
MLACGTGPTGAVMRPLDGGVHSGVLSRAGNAHAGEGSRGGVTTSPPAVMATLWISLKNACGKRGGWKRKKSGGEGRGLVSAAHSSPSPARHRPPVPVTTLNRAAIGSAPLWISRRRVDERRTREKKSRKGEGPRARADAAALLLLPASRRVRARDTLAPPHAATKSRGEKKCSRVFRGGVERRF